jgi:homoserine acetyltransferase
VIEDCGIPGAVDVRKELGMHRSAVGTAVLLCLALSALPARAHGPTPPPHPQYRIGDLLLESGEVITDFTIAYVTHGTLNAQKSNAILMAPGMNGDHLEALRAMKARTLVLTGRKDLLNPEWEPLEAARHIRDVRAVTISPQTITGHASAGGLFPADVDFLNTEIAGFLDVVGRGARPR